MINVGCAEIKERFILYKFLTYLNILLHNSVLLISMLKLNVKKHNLFLKIRLIKYLIIYKRVLYYCLYNFLHLNLFITVHLLLSRKMFHVFKYFLFIYSTNSFFNCFRHLKEYCLLFFSDYYCIYNIIMFLIILLYKVLTFDIGIIF